MSSLTNKVGMLTNIKWMENHRLTIRIVVLLTFTAFIIRMYRLDFLTLWVDEYVHYLRARDFVYKDGPLFTNDNNGILLTMIIIPLFKLFGASETTARFPSVLFGALSIPLTFFIAKRLFNRYIGLLASVMMAFSLYGTFWSRVSRNYANFQFFYLLLVIVFILAYEPLSVEIKKQKKIFHKNNLHLKYILLLPVALLVSLLSHQLTFLFAFSVGVYGSSIALVKILKKERGAYLNKYSLVLYPTILVAAMFYTPVISNVTKNILSAFLPPQNISWFIPDFNAMINELADPQTRFNIFNVYYKVISSDLDPLYYIGLLGFPTVFVLNKKSGIFLFSFFVVPFLLLSFLFKSPSLPRYLLFIYPFFIISISAGVYFLIKYPLSIILPDHIAQKTFFRSLITFSVIGLVLYGMPFKDIKELITTDHHGVVVKRELSSWVFVNWKKPAVYIKKYFQKGDIVLTTGISPIKVYMDLDSPILFRQVHYDTEKKQYVLNEQENKPVNSAVSYEDFLRTYQANKRGWLLTDYYFYNVMTDQRAREFVIRNFKYHFTFSKEGDIQVFSWDHSNPEPQKSILAEVGKGNKLASPEYNINLNGIKNAQAAYFILDCEGIDNNMEAVLVVNKKYSTYIPQSNSLYRTNITMQVDKSWLSENNTIQFGYNKNTKDVLDGFVIYNVNVQLR